MMANINKALFIVVVLAYLKTLHAAGYNILLLSLQLKSHYMGNLILADELLDRGHTVYMVLGSEFETAVKVCIISILCVF